MNRFTCWLLVMFLFGGFVAVVVYALRARVEAGKGMPEYSVYSEEYNGLSGTARFVRVLLKYEAPEHVATDTFVEGFARYLRSCGSPGAVRLNAVKSVAATARLSVTKKFPYQRRK